MGYGKSTNMTKRQDAGSPPSAERAHLWEAAPRGPRIPKCYVCVYIYIYIYIGLLPVSVKKRSFYENLLLATQQQELLSRPLFGIFQAHFPKGIIIRRSVFVHGHR